MTFLEYYNKKKCKNYKNIRKIEKINNIKLIYIMNYFLILEINIENYTYTYMYIEIFVESYYLNY